MPGQLFDDYEGPRRRVVLAPRDCLFRRGDPAAGPVMVESGRVRLLRHLADGAEVTLFDAPAGSVFAQISTAQGEGSVTLVVEALAGAGDSEIARIRGLGFYGILVLGGHHPHHHQMIARGQAPH